MKIFKYILVMGVILSLCGSGYAADVQDDRDSDSKPSSNAGSSILTGALMGGLLGGGIGAAIGSASGHAGTGALIGGGVGAAGGSLLGASQQDKQRKEASSYSKPQVPKDTKIKKKVIREYDDQGNVVSEKEVKGESAK